MRVVIKAKLFSENIHAEWYDASYHSLMRLGKGGQAKLPKRNSTNKNILILMFSRT